MKKKLAMMMVVLALVGCSSARRAALFSAGSKHKVELYSGGVCVRTWISRGMVSSESQSDGFFFEDDVTGKLIVVSGPVVITQE